ncbi:MAG: LacI family DNA-binding transcriptional regulator [Clostridia bacterium]|nr:LacI family DNA-binding transcriptional regulator [Clostridia bacterium]
MSTISDVARLAGVSVATVSHVVNKTRYVSPELVKRVEDAINSLEYPPNFVVKKSKTLQIPSDLRYIVMLTSDIQNPFQRQIIRFCESLVEAAGFVFVSADYHDAEEHFDLLSHLLFSSNNAAGLIFLPGPDQIEQAVSRMLKTLKIPVVCIGSHLSGLDCDIVLSDNSGGAYKATTHLIRSGHEKIAMICGNKLSESNLDRIAGYRKALKDNGIELPEDFVLTERVSEEQVFAAMRQLMTAPNPPTAVFAANYLTILSVIKYINANNISCPQELSVVGFNDFDWAPFLNPPITTVAQDIARIGELAVQSLLEQIELEAAEPNESSKKKSIRRTEIVPTELRVRNSTYGIGRGPFGEKAVSPDVLLLSDADKKVIQSGHYKAAIAFHYTGKAWMRLHEQGIKDIFSSLGISILAVTDAHFDPEMQSKQLESLLSFEPDVIITLPTDNIKTAPVFKKIAQSKTKLVLITNVPSGLTIDDYVTCVSVNERSYGRSIGRGLGDYMRHHNKRKIAFLKHGADFYATNQRDKAAEQILVEEYPELQIVASYYFSNEENAYDRTLELFGKYPEIEGLYISWEGPAMMALSALTELGHTDIAIATADLEYPVALNMAKGGMVKVLSAQTPYEQGQAMALAAANALINKPVPSFIGVEPIVITPENLLKSWQKVFHERSPAQLSEAINENPQLPTL